MAEINALVIESVKKFLSKLKEEGIHIERSYLYGSCAKGEENKWSDIDIVLISPDFSDNRFEEGMRLMKISSTIDSRIEPVPFRPDTFVDEDPLVWEVKKQGILLE
ncbi:MAG: nucleotidyltransferase domain-containing protein [bacterium]